MNRRVSLVLVGVLAVLAGACQQAATLSDQDKAAIRQTNEEATKLATAKPVDAAAYVEKYYAEDAEVLSPNMPPLKGRPAILQNVASFPPLSVFETEILDVDGHDGTAFVRGNYNMTMNRPGAGPVNDRGRYVQMWKKQADGGWRVAYELFNSDLPLSGLTLPTASSPAEGNAEVKALSPLVGQWAMEGTFVMDAKGTTVPTKATQGCEWYAGGFAVACRTTGTMGGATNESIGLIYYDALRKSYVNVGVGSVKDSNGSGTLEIKPGTFVFTSDFLLEGKPVKDRMTLSNMTADGGTLKYEMAMAGGPFKPAGEGKYVRVKLP